MVTIKQLAELSNVSRGTVDKVLNNRPGVKEETRKKVLKISKEMNYQPNIIGKTLVNNKKPIKIGIILTPAHNQFIQATLQGIQNAAKEYTPYGVQVITKMPVTLEAAERLSLLKELKDEDVNSIALFPIDDPAIISYANQLIKGGTTIITINSDLLDINRAWFVGQNHYKGGRTAAELMCKLLPRGGTLGVIISSHDFSCHQDRLKGFIDKIEEAHIDFIIADVQENQDIKQEAFRATLEYCNQTPDLAGIYITGGGISGVASALKITQKVGLVKVICHDLLPDSEQLLCEDVIDFVIDQKPANQGYLIVKSLFEYYNRRTLPEDNSFSVPIEIRTKETLE